MSSTQATTDYTTDDYTATRRVSTETKASFKTTELIAYVATVIGVLVAAAIADESSDFGTQEAWFYVSLLTIGYPVLQRGRGACVRSTAGFPEPDG
jgi:biotin transporter BioY